MPSSDVRDRVRDRAAQGGTRSDSPQRVEDSTLAGWLRSANQQAEIAAALPATLDPDRFIRMALTTAKATPKLLEATRESYLGAIMHAAQLGLEPGPLDHCYILPFNNKVRRNPDVWQVEAQFILGYKGMIDLAMRSGRLASVEARTVYRDEEFEVEYGTDFRIYHKPLVDVPASEVDDEREVLCYYAIARYPGGGYYAEHFTMAQLARLRRMSKQPDGEAWRKHPDRMYRKTCIRQIRPYLPMSSEVAAALAGDEQVTRMKFDDHGKAFIDTTVAADPEPPASTSEPADDGSPADAGEPEESGAADDPERPFDD